MSYIEFINLILSIILIFFNASMFYTLLKYKQIRNKEETLFLYKTLATVICFSFYFILFLAFFVDSNANNREFILAAVRQNGSVLDLVDERYKQDKKIVMAAVKQNGYALQYADDSLKQDNEVVMAAMKQKSDALYDADESLRFNEEMQMLEEKYDKMQNNVIIKKLIIKIENIKKNINYELYKIKFKLQAKFEPQGKKL